MSKTRFTVPRFKRARGIVLDIMSRVSYYHLSHKDMLTHRERLYASEDYKRLPEASRSELDGMLRGLTEWLHISRSVVWCHKLDGRFYEPQQWRELGGDYLTYNPQQSQFVWKATLESDEQRMW